MKILSASQIREWDQYTIQNEPIASIDLMERAAKACVTWLRNQSFFQRPFKIFCGKGNNGGDGLAIARLLYKEGVRSEVFILEFGRKGTPDFQINLQRLHDLPIPIHFIQSEDHFPQIKRNEIIIDALYGSGLNKPLEGLSAALVTYLNNCDAPIISIDVPSGLFMDQSSEGNIIISARHTLTFQVQKFALLVAENADYIGQVHVINIGLHPQYLENIETAYEVVEPSFIKQFYKPRNRFAHKGKFGHAMIMGGSYGKIGAAVLATTACLKTGAGLVTAYIPKCGYTILQSTVPEAMVLTDDEENCISSLPFELEKYSVIGLGPGLGTERSTQQTVKNLLQQYQKPLVIDADGLNCLSLQPEVLKILPPYSILTPHPKEFDRLFGTHENNFDRIATAHKKAEELKVIIVLKGHHTLTALPENKSYFNTTGNAGMAKGGSGDVLTGIITALVAQGYPPAHAAIFGVYLHGLAGDWAAQALSMETIVASDIITFLSQAYRKFHE
ncbi:MAG: NAD(P)H-hydrate dehydratase [Flavisolibacter sp.]|nr:NAD(P)H-hydrate dehydratase [Flavisolibacter sp.]